MMPLTLYAATVPTMQQTIAAMEGLLDKAESWCSEQNCDAWDLIGARLADDMHPFNYQVKSCWVHSAFALSQCEQGTFSPHMEPAPDSFAGLREVLAQAASGLAKVDEQQLENMADNDLIFSIGDKFRLDFTVQNFLLGFTQPNFFFHATSAYAIMRGKGVKIGKMDFMGPLRTKAA